MENFYEEYDREILEMMSNPTWWFDKQKKRKLELLRSARRVRKTSSISAKMGGVLIWQQVLEQFLKEIILTSISYIKAEIWPTKIDFKVDLDRKTFGQLINDYENFSLDYKDKNKILTKLRFVNDNRNKIVHKLFNIDNMIDLEDYFKSNFKTYEELLPLILDHYCDIGECLEDLTKRVDWEDFLDELNNKKDI